MADHWNDLVAAHGRVADTSDGTMPVHQPKAAVLACSDARVPPSVIFDQPAGSLFVIRIAGNTAGPAALASLDYAVDQLGVELVVVLGHTGCGAVHAAATGTCGGYLAPIVAPICEIAKANPGTTDERLVELNVVAAIETLEAHDGPTGRAARTGDVHLQGAVHDVRSSSLTPLETPTLPIQPRTTVETS